MCGCNGLYLCGYHEYERMQARRREMLVPAETIIAEEDAAGVYTVTSL